MPLSVGDEAGDVAAAVVAAVALQLQVDAAHVVRPRAKLHLTKLIVERKPRDVDLARAQKKSGRNPQAVAVGRQDHVRRESAIDVLVGAACIKKICQRHIR